MTTKISGLNLAYEISSLERTFSTTSFINCINHRENFKFLDYLDNRSVGVAYVKGNPISAKDNLFIVDKSSTVFENCIINTNPVSLTDITSFSINTDRFYLTNVYTSSNEPLFFKHIIGEGVLPRTNGVVDSNYRIIKVDVLDQNFSVVTSQITDITITNGEIYNNLENYYNNDSDYKAYYIQYTYYIVGNNRYNYGLEILNNKELFLVAEYSDLDADFKLINDGRKVYLLEEKEGYYSITLPSIGNYSYKVIKKSNLHILPPKISSTEEQWNISIPNSKILANVNGNYYKFTLNEFSEQLWNPQLPIKRVEQEKGIIVNSRLIKALHLNLQNSTSLDYFVEVLVNGKEGEGVAAFTTDYSKYNTLASNGVYYNCWHTVRKIGIESFDEQNSFIDLNGISLKKDEHEVYINYYYEEKEYLLNSLNFNPINNPSILEKTIILFLSPDTTEITNTQNLFYLVVNNSGRVEISNWSQFNNNTKLLLNGNKLYYSEIPSWDLSPNTSIFTTTYSIEGAGSFFILGEVSINENSSIKDLSIIDVRTKGGGLKKEVIENKKTKNQEINWFWDIGNFDGKFYPRRNSILIQIPTETLLGAGGLLTNKEVRDIVLKHMDFGSYPIIKGYGIDVKIEDIYSTSSSIVVSWNSTVDASFNIYYSLLPEGPWTLSNLAPISNDTNGNTTTISDLDSNKKYYIMVVPGVVESSVFYPRCSQSVGTKATEASLVQNPENVICIKTLRA